MIAQHIYSRGLLGLGSVREDTPNPQETGGPREWGSLVQWQMEDWEHPHGEEDVEQSEDGPGWGYNLDYKKHIK